MIWDGHWFHFVQTVSLQMVEVVTVALGWSLVSLCGDCFFTDG